MVIEGAVIAGLGAVLIGLYKRFGRKWVKKIFDDPSTPEDESASIDGFAQQVIHLAAERAAREAIKEAKKNPGLDARLVAAEKLVEQFKGKVDLEQAKKLVGIHIKF